MATIKIADDIHPVRSNTGTIGSSSGVPGGIYSLRNVSRASVDRRSLSKVSLDRRSEKITDVEEAEDEGPGLAQAGDFKKKQVFKGKVLLWLAYQSIGVIYGDIGTSPLYVYSSTFESEPSYDDLVEVLSLIIWTITIIVTIKYIFIVLRADNEGEGGTFSCYSLLTRYANISKRDPREASLIKMERYVSTELRPPNRNVRSTIEKSRFLRGLLQTIGVLAVSMVMSDGVLTPAQSVLGAVQGLKVVKPDISTGTIVGTSCGILVILFLIQPLGTSKIASFFAPVVITWLGFNAGFGIYNLINFDHSVLRAFSPVFAFRFFVRNKTRGWRMLGGVLLAFTGVEALFADLGAFSRRAIQLSWMCYTFPCLLLAYIGQAAYISVHPAAYDNPFYKAVPPGMLYPSLVVAILAAIVASQAIITATFQLLSQIMKLSYFPQVKVVHTSRIFHGQLYVPFLNWVLMCGTILVTAVYHNTTRLGNAYGVCVMFVTFFDTCMVTLVALIVWRLSPFLVFAPWIIIACVDCLYLSSALNKVPDGAWFTLTLAGALASTFMLWRFGKEQQWQAEAEDRFQPTHLMKTREDGQIHLTDRFGGGALTTIRGFGIFFDKAGEMTPTVFIQFVSKLVATPEVMVFFHLRPLETPSVPIEERYTVSRFSIPGCYRLVIRHGFTDEVITPDLAVLVYEQVREFIIRQDKFAMRRNPAILPSQGYAEEKDDTTTVAKTSSAPSSGTTMAHNSASRPSNETDIAVMTTELTKLHQAYSTQTLYVIGKEQMKIKAGTGLWRRILLTTFLWLRDNTRTKIANLRVSTDRVIEVGFVKEV